MSLELDLPGFRFHPTEEELLNFYLRNTVSGKKSHYNIIGLTNIYHYDPWELPGMYVCIYIYIYMHVNYVLNLILFLFSPFSNIIIGILIMG